MTIQHTDHASTIIAFIEQQFPAARGEVSPSSDLLGTGLIDSLGILDIVEFLEEQFGILVDDLELVPENFERVEVIVAFVERKRAAVG